MNLYWSLTDSKFPHASRILISILADLKTAVVWMVLILPLISSFDLLSIHLRTVPSTPTTLGITVILMFFRFFLNSQARSKYCYIFSLSLIFNLWSEWKNLLYGKFSFFLNFFIKVWSSDRDSVIRLNLKIQENFVHLILWGRFWFVHILFFSIARFQFLP